MKLAACQIEGHATCEFVEVCIQATAAAAAAARRRRRARALTSVAARTRVHQPLPDDLTHSTIDRSTSSELTDISRQQSMMGPTLKRLVKLIHTVENDLR